MAGPFFSEGSYTKNSEQEVDQMMENLEKWSSAITRVIILIDIPFMYALLYVYVYWNNINFF